MNRALPSIVANRAFVARAVGQEQRAALVDALLEVVEPGDGALDVRADQRVVVLERRPVGVRDVGGCRSRRRRARTRPTLDRRCVDGIAAVLRPARDRRRRRRRRRSRGPGRAPASVPNSSAQSRATIATSLSRSSDGRREAAARGVHRAHRVLDGDPLLAAAAPVAVGAAEGRQDDRAPTGDDVRAVQLGRDLHGEVGAAQRRLDDRGVGRRATRSCRPSR